MDINLYEQYFDSTLWSVPYYGSYDLMEDICAYIDMYVETALLIREERQKGQPYRLSGIVITPDEVKAAIDGGKLPYRNDVLKEEVAESIRKGYRHILSRKEKSGTLRLFEIKERFLLNAFEFFALMLGLCAEMDRKYERLFGYLQDNVNQTWPTLGLAKALYSLTDIIPENCVFLSCQEGRRAEMILFGATPSDKKTPLLAKQIKIPEKIVSYVNDINEIGKNIRFCCSRTEKNSPLGTVYVNQEALLGLTKTVQAVWKEKEPVIIHLFGPKGTGKFFAVRYMGQKAGRNVFSFDVEIALHSGKNMEELLKNALIEAITENSLFCLRNIPVLQEDGERMLQTMIRLCRDYIDVLFLTSAEKEVYDYALDYKVLQVSYEMPEFDQRLLLWKEFLKERNISPGFDVAGFANKFILSPKQIQNVIASASLSAVYAGRDEMLEEDVLGAIRNQSLNRLREKATLVKAVYTWDDLIAEPEQKKMMMYAVNHIKYKNKVNQEWGFGRKLAYGRGLSVLFYGPPGTGKTMAAQVIANELKLELYKVDLSQMVSKYIGETEKNLTVLFNEAKYSNAILFFDEADALFSKRTEVTDSKDKYSNVETSFLLQKMEEFEGITILASNYLVNFDDAFKRRIRFIINFQLPGPDMRYKLWTSMIPKTAPTDGNIDYEFLAQNFEFSGSNIKNITISAAYMAAAEDTAISMKHIVAAIKVENAKVGKVLLKHEFGRYAEYY